MYQLRSSSKLAIVLIALGAVGCANRVPVLNCIPTRPSVIEGDTVTLESNASDPDKKDRLTFNWAADSGKLTAQNGSAVFDSSGLEPGDYSVSLEVRDKKQNTASCQVEVAVEKRKLPPSATCEPRTVSIIEGQSTVLSARTSDPNGDELTFHWSVDGGSISNAQPSFTFGSVGRSIGAHSVNVTVTDVDGMTADCSFNVTLQRRPNTDPSCSLTVTPSEVYQGAEVTVTVTASDKENDPLSYSWQVDGAGTSGRGTSKTVDTRRFGGGTHTISVRVQDDRDGSCRAEGAFSVREKITLQIPGTRLDNVAKAVLDEVALKLRQTPGLRALITGHTDDRGSEQGNERMGQIRADAVKEYLVAEHNVEATRIETRSAGEDQPAADNSTAEGRKANRRVELELFAP